jgi:hypothetical protein
VRFRNWIFVALAFVGATLWTIRSRTERAIETTNPVAHVTSSAPEIRVPAARKPLQKIYSAPRPKMTEAEKATLAVSPGCSRTWDKLRTQNFVEDKRLTGLTPDVLTDCDAPPPELKAVHSQFVKACAEFNDPKKRNDESQQNCTVASLQYRGMIAQKLNGNRKLEDIDDIGVLSDLLLANLYGDQSTEASRDSALRGAIDVAERMLEVDPALPLHTLVAGARTMDYLESRKKGGPPDGPLKEASLRHLDRLLKIEPNNNRALSAKIWVEGEGDPRKHREAALAAEKSRPDSPVPLYHIATASAALQDMATADRKMEEGRERFPDEPNFQKDSKSLSVDIKFSTNVDSILAGDASASSE